MSTTIGMEVRGKMARKISVLLMAVLFIGVVALPVGAEPVIRYNGTTQGQVLGTSSPTINVTISNSSQNVGTGNISTIRFWLKNHTRNLDPYSINGTSWTSSGNHWLVNFSNNSFSFRNATEATIGGEVVINSTGGAKRQGLTLNNASGTTQGYVIFTFDSNFTAITPGLYSAMFSVVDTAGNANDTHNTGLYLNFSIAGADVSQSETYLDSVLSTATSNFRNAANTADAAGDMLRTSRYSLAVTITADGTVLTIGNFSTFNWGEIGDIATTASASVGTSNDPSNTQNRKRAWIDIGDYVATANMSWARALFTGTYNYVYTLTGTAATPTWTPIGRYCDSMGSIMDGTAVETMPCIWKPGDGNTYGLLSSFSGVAVADSAGGSNLLFGGGGGSYVPKTTSKPKTTTSPQQTTEPTTPIKEGSWLYENALWVIIGIVIVGLAVLGLLATASGGKARYRRR